MQISDELNEEGMKEWLQENNIRHLHDTVHRRFGLPEHVLHSPNPEENLKEWLAKEPTFFFSFVRHPYAR